MDGVSREFQMRATLVGGSLEKNLPLTRDPTLGRSYWWGVEVPVSCYLKYIGGHWSRKVKPCISNALETCGKLWGAMHTMHPIEYAPGRRIGLPG